MASKTVHTPAYLDTPAAVDDFLNAISATPILALDTEGASFHRFVDRIYLLQLSTRDQTAVIDPLPIGTPAGLARLVEDPNVEILFHDADYDLRLLHQDYGWRVTNIFDTRVAAQLLGLRAFGLAALLERYFDIKLDKKHQRADWSMRPLTKDMLDYAALDTMYLLDLRDRLKGELEERGRWGWAAEEFARLEGTQWAPEEDGTAFLRVKGARDLNRRELALLRELVQWRDGVARELDRSTFRVVSNDVLLEIARQAPTTREALGAIKGMPRGVVENRGQEVLGCVRAGQAVSDAELPRFPKAPRYDRDPEFDDKVARLKAVRDAAAARLELDPGVLCSRDRIEAVVRRNPRTLDDLLEVPGMRRWQAAEIGDGFIRALEKPASGAGTPTIAQALTQADHANPNAQAALSSSATSENDSPYKDA